MRCVTGKNGYYAEAEVQEALIRSQINFIQGAINYYVCNECGEFHLTSQGERHPLLSDDEVQLRIKQERLSQDWEGRLRK